MKRILLYTWFILIFILLTLTGCNFTQKENDDALVSVEDIIQPLLEKDAENTDDEKEAEETKENEDEPDALITMNETPPAENLYVYIPVVEDAIAAGGEWYENSVAPGVLFDMDQDGVRELIMLYREESAAGRYCVYSVDNETLSEQIDSGPLYSMVSVPLVKINVIENNGTRYLLAYYNYCDGENEKEKYSLYDADTYEFFSTFACYQEFYDYNEAGEFFFTDVPVVSYLLNEEPCSEQEYMERLDDLASCAVLAELEIESSDKNQFGENGTSLEDLLAYQKNEFGRGKESKPDYIESEDESSLTYTPDDNAGIGEDETLDDASERRGAQDNFWREFLDAKAYMPYVDSLFVGGYDSYLQSGGDELQFEYAEYDLNSDGIPELMLFAPDSTSPFGSSMLFAIQNGDAQLVYSTYGYGCFSYSPQFEAVTVPPGTRPNYTTAYTVFYSFNGSELVYMFTVGSDLGECFFDDGSEWRTISEEELEAYTTDLIDFDWIAIE